MGFPLAYPQLTLPTKLLLPILSLLILLRNLTVALVGFLGLSDSTATSWEPQAVALHHHHRQDSIDDIHSVLPVVRFSTLLVGDRGVFWEERCTVCLLEFQADDEIMLPMTCRHVFHRSCLDRWIGYNHRICPLCRSPLVGGDDLPGTNVGSGDDVMGLY